MNLALVQVLTISLFPSDCECGTSQTVFVYLWSQDVLLRSHRLFMLDKKKSDLCVGGQYYSVYQADKYPSHGKMMALTKQIVGKCIWE